MKIISNNKPRFLTYGYELSAKEKSDFDYIEADEIDLHEFVRYNGHVYDCSEFMRTGNNEALKCWDGYTSDTYFSGVLIKLSGDGESAIMGRYFS